MVVAAVVGAGVVGAAATVYSANSAASAQENATKSANDTTMAMYNQTAERLQPFTDTGTFATNKLTSNYDALTAPISMTQADLEQTPGYQFNLTQGLKATQNSAAARGLGSSGAALKGAASYATGLADSTYQQQYNNALTNRNLQLNTLENMANLGENAAAQTGAAGTSAAQTISSNTVGAGNAAAAADIATGNAISGIGSSTANALLNAKYMGLYGGSTVAGTGYLY